MKKHILLCFALLCFALCRRETKEKERKKERMEEKTFGDKSKFANGEWNFV